MQPRHPHRLFRRGLVAAATVALGAVTVLGTAGTAGAHPQLTDTQRQCMTDALAGSGITLPQKPADGTKPAEGSRPQLTQEQRDAMKAAAEKCGLPAMGQGRGNRPQLTDEQKQCLTDALSASGITLPQKPADGTKPAEGSRPQLTQEQRDAMKAAAEKCGLPPIGPRGQQPGQAGQNV